MMKDWQAKSIKNDINFCHRSGYEKLEQLEHALEAVSHDKIWNKQFNASEITEMRSTIYEIMGAMKYCLDTLKENADNVVDEAVELEEQISELQNKLEDCGYYDEAI